MKVWSPHSAATRHVWHSGKNCATNTHSVITPCRVKPRLGTGTSVATSLVGEGLPQPCCAVERVVKEGRTGSSLPFPISFLAQAHAHALTQTHPRVFSRSAHIFQVFTSEAAEAGSWNSTVPASEALVTGSSSSPAANERRGFLYVKQSKRFAE